MKTFCVLLACIALAGCATTSGLSAHSEVSNFDGSRTVSIDPHGTWCGMRMNPCAMVGAQWNSAHPDSAFLDIEMIWQYTGIEGAEVNIGGQITRLTPSKYPTQFSNVDPGSAWGPMLRQSDQSFVVPLALIREMATAPDVRIRVDTTEGYDDGVIISPEHDSKAYYALQRFLAKVDAK